MVHGGENLLVEKASDGRKSNEQVGLHHLDRVDQSQTLEPGVVHGEAGEVVEQVLHLLQVLPRLQKCTIFIKNGEFLVYYSAVHEISACHFTKTLLTFVMSPSASQM